MIEMLSGQGHALSDLLAAAGLPRSTYYRARSHPPRPTRPELWEKVAEVFSRTANGCGHRQVAMALRAEEDVAIADKTALKIMHEMGISCGIRRESDYHRYNSFKGVVGRAFDNVLDRGFSADEPWQKLGTDVTEFKAPWGRAYFAPAYDFGSKEIVSWSISRSANMAQQKEMLEGLLAKMPEAASPVMHSDMGWQYQHDVLQDARGGGHRPEHVEKGQLHRQRRDRAGLRPYQGRVLPRAELRELRGVQGEARGVHRPLEHEAKAG